MNRRAGLLWCAEPYEWLGLLASAAALCIFFLFGSRLDALTHQPAYHWHVVSEITGIYAHFVPWMVAGASVVTAGVWWRLRNARRSVLRRFAAGLRFFLAYCLLLIVFRIVNFYVPVLHPGIRDAVMQKIDAHLFLNQQVAQWLAPFISPWLTHISTAAYVSWFWLLFATIGLMVTESPRAASEYMLASLLAFYAGYVCYVLVPVVGPGYTFHYAAPVGDIAARYTADTLTLPRDCFPSLHTALSVIMVVYVWRHRRRWTWLYAPLAVLIVFATLYLRFHYGIDDIAGAALGITMAYVAPALQTWWERTRSARGTVLAQDAAGEREALPMTQTDSRTSLL